MRTYFVGGARIGAGRHKVADKKIQVAIGIRESVIRKLGGEAMVKSLIKDEIRKKASRMSSPIPDRRPR